MMVQNSEHQAPELAAAAIAICSADQGDYLPKKTHTLREDGVLFLFIYFFSFVLHFISGYYSIHISHNPHMPPTHNPFGGNCQSFSPSIPLFAIAV